MKIQNQSPRLAACSLVLLLSVGAPLVAEASDESDATGIGWTYVNLDLDVTVLPRQQKIEVEGRAVLRLDSGASLGPSIGLNSQAKIMTMTRLDASPDAASIELNQFLSDDFPNAKVSHLRYERPFKPGDEVSITFAYESDGQSSQFKSVGRMTIASWTEVWHPVPLFDNTIVALSKALSSIGTTRFHLPTGWRAAAEGRLVDRTEHDDGVTETWQLDTSLARSFAAAPFTKATHAADGREVNVFMMSKDLAQGAEDQAKILARAMVAMEKRFGPYPYPSYSIIEIPESMMVPWYAASQQGLIFARSTGFRAEGGNVPLFAHEMAHGWWGNLVGTTGDGSILCSESLAQYGAVVAIEELEGIDARDEFLRFSRKGYSKLQCANGYFFMWREGHDKPMRDLESAGWSHNLSDAKGHWVYHMLRGRVGDEVFFTTLRTLIDNYAGKRLSLDDVRAAYTSAAPDADLDTFFAQWLDRTGAPVIDLDWWATDNGEGVHVTVTQSQPGDPFQLDLELGVLLAGGEVVVHTVAITEATHEFDCATDARPLEVTLDPNHRILLWRPEYGPRHAGSD